MVSGSTSNASATPLRWQTLLFVGLSLSIGWGIRGNYGHQWGAALPGALAAMAAVLISKRDDWVRRIAYFGVFGAAGWAIGACMAYMVLIAYTHSGHSGSVLYGFYCLFVVGFLWGAVGGMGTALPAYLSREKLSQFVVPFIILFIAWWAENQFEAHFIDTVPKWHKHSPMDWFDTDWMSALLTIILIPLRGIIRRKLDWAERLIIACAAGWWIGFLILKVGLHVSMAPNKSESWVGNLGLTIALFVYLWRTGVRGAVLSGAITGVLGGAAFALAVLFKLTEIKSGLDTNWHSVLEQSYGFMNGVALAVAFIPLFKRAPIAVDEPAVPGFYNGFMVAFLMLLLTYLNMWKQVTDWTDSKAIKPQMYFLTTAGWFDLFYFLLAATFIWLIRSHLRKPIALVPQSALGKAQLLFLALNWWMIIANFMKALVSFDKVRLITEGTIFVNGLLVSLMCLLWANETHEQRVLQSAGYEPLLRRAWAFGALLFAVVPVVCWAGVRAMYGDQFAGYAGHHYRFGPKAKPTGE